MPWDAAAMHIRTLATLCSTLALTACSKSEPPAAPPAATPVVEAPAPPVNDAGTALLPVATATPQERAPQEIAKFKGSIVGELQKAVAAQGAAGAISVCGDAAAKARDAMTTPELAIGRTSSKLRNPGNVAPAWVAPALAQLEKAAPAERKPITLKQPDGTLGYVEPLVIVPLCLQCHGAALADDVKAALKAKYPGDTATGYAEGDVRGVVWVALKPTGG
jgi:Protein of unknown function (DUF3365)